MSILNKVYYHTWNIGFVEKSVEAIVSSKETSIEVHWIKHQYKNRFFADPFILSADDKYIKVLLVSILGVKIIRNAQFYIKYYNVYIFTTAF